MSTPDTPNAGRVYDYLLGGANNFAVDQAVGDRFKQLLPALAEQLPRLNRWFMYEIVQELANQGFNAYLDLASGVPTQGYIHELAPQATVLYNDIDPVTVKLGQEIIGANPRVRYIQGDLRDIDTILDHAEQFLQHDEPLGICFVGVAYFIDDAAMAQVMQRLYDWAAPGSQLAVSSFVLKEITPEWQEILQTYDSMKASVYLRPYAELTRLLEPWKPVRPLRPLVQIFSEKGYNMDHLNLTAASEQLYGGLLVKP